MTRQDIEDAIGAELGRIAPDIDLDDIDRSSDLREECDIDSMDFLTLITALGQRFKIEIPEADYAEMDSFDAMTTYLDNKTG